MFAISFSVDENLFHLETIKEFMDCEIKAINEPIYATDFRLVYVAETEDEGNNWIEENKKYFSEQDNSSTKNNAAAKQTYTEQDVPF